MIATSWLMGLMTVVVAQQQPQVDTTFAIRSGSRVEVETFGGEINVKTWDKGSIRVQATHGRRDVIDIDARGSSVRIEAEGRMGPATAVTFDITVPPSVSLGLSGVYTDITVDGVDGDIDAETVQGGIRVTGGGRLKLESVEGDIIVERARGRISANTVNRGIRITNSTGDIEAETVNGPIVMQTVQATHVDAATVNGRIVYDGSIRDGGDYAISTHNGAVWIIIPENAGATISVSTFNGELDSSLPISLREASSKRRYSFVFGSGRARIDLESFGGDIHLRRPGESIPTQLEPPAKPKAKVKIR